MINVKVLTKEGKKEISDLKINDLVLSYNEITKEYEYNRVINITEKEIEEIYEITINNKIITISNTHPFYNGKEYIKISNLKEKDKILGLDNKYYEIEKIEKIEENTKEINITVEKNHNYFIEEGYLVHNYGGHPSNGSGTHSYWSGGGGSSGPSQAEIEEARRQARIRENREKAAKIEKEIAEKQEQYNNYSAAVTEFSKGINLLRDAVGGPEYDKIINKATERYNDLVKTANDTANEIGSLKGQLTTIYNALKADRSGDVQPRVDVPTQIKLNNEIESHDTLYYTKEIYEDALKYFERGIEYFDAGNKGAKSKSDSSAYYSSLNDKNSNIYSLVTKLKDMQKSIENAMSEFGSDVSKLKTDIQKSPMTGDFGTLTTKNDWVVDMSKYKNSNNGTDGFGLFIDSRKYYSIEDFSTKLANVWGFNTSEQAFEAFVGVVIADGGNKTPDDILASASVIFNRCVSDTWIERGTKENDPGHYGTPTDGNNPFDQTFRSKYGETQYQFTTVGGRLPSGLRKYEAYMPSVVGKEAVEKKLDELRNGTIGMNDGNSDVCTYDEAIEVIYDAMYGGLRNTDFTGMRKAGGELGGVAMTKDGGCYLYENNEVDPVVAKAAQESRVEVNVSGNPYYIGQTTIKVMPPNFDTSEGDSNDSFDITQIPEFNPSSI